MTQADSKRLKRRDELWPDAEDLVGNPEEKGWWRAPRVLPLLLSLTRDKRITPAPCAPSRRPGKVKVLDCSSVYLELLSRDFGQGFVEILDEDEHAFCAGYFSSRATRSWRERVSALEKAGFLRVKAKGNRTIGYVLLLNPHRVAARLNASGKIDDAWWQMYLHRLQAVGGEPPAIPATSLRVVPARSANSTT
jgi:hypothetical protein